MSTTTPTTTPTTMVDHPYERDLTLEELVAHMEAAHGGFMPGYDQSAKDQILADPEMRRSLHGILHNQHWDND